MVKTVEFEVLRKIGNVEIRQYPEILLATVTGMEDDSSFGILFNYINGHNLSRKKVAMTSPVISSEKIPMTAPVISDSRFFTFVLPDNYTLETVPKPEDPRVNIHVQPARKFAVLRFGGRTNSAAVERESGRLLKCLADNGMPTRGGVFLMRYNSPFAPGFMRRNEVGIEIVGN
uniref:SOUL heme-binding protein n=1 Tax=uncultured Thermoplasmata archaeon TaxID=376542 RepID=A0A871YEF5_9ARCH|nr:SOUL heme-binding protein [uncultured Thermoplasmata archaeon]